MYARVKLLGDGSPNNGYHVDLPAYSIVSMDTAAKWAIVSIFYPCAPTDLPPRGTPLYPLMNGVYVLIGLSQPQMITWLASLARQYPYQIPPFSPELV